LYDIALAGRGRSGKRRNSGKFKIYPKKANKAAEVCIDAA